MTTLFLVKGMEIVHVHKQVPLFEYETFKVRRVRCAETNDLPRKPDR
jgi:hypothetical protein